MVWGIEPFTYDDAVINGVDSTCRYREIATERTSR